MATLEAQLASFQAHLASSKRILALLGAGLSASSGLSTFRGKGGMWRNYDATALATPEAFEADPGLVWQFYSHRRHNALNVKPNPAHYALAELARKKEEFITLTQNVDGLSQRASHPPSKLHLLHGNLFDIKCFNPNCTYLEPNNLSDPLVPSLAVTPNFDIAPPLGSSLSSRIPQSELPHCPSCKTGLLRPGVVWFGEALPEGTLNAVDKWIEEGPIDLMLVIGTAAEVWPAASYIEIARSKGARVAVVNIEDGVVGRGRRRMTARDWMFVGDAAVLVPRMLEGVIGELKVPE